MTAKRDLKKRVRARQAQTGESYMVARRQVMSAVEEPEAESAAHTTIPVDELIDLTEAAIDLGLRCSVLVFPDLAAQADPVMVLTRVRDALLQTTTDPDTELLRALALRGQPATLPPRRSPEDHARFVARVTAGLGGTSSDGRMLALHVEGKTGIVPVLCAAWRADPQLVLMTPEDSVYSTLSRLGVRASTTERPLFLLFEGRRYPLTKAPFVIGRTRVADLQIKDGLISRKHAAILYKAGSFYIKDLGSTAGLEYLGMKIDNKRIQEGDVFKIGPYELQFTFRAIDA